MVPKKIVLLFLIFILYEVNSGFIQKRGRVEFFNEKYTKDVTLLTYKDNRHSPYYNTINFTLLVPMNNNVSVLIEFGTKYLKGLPLRVEHKMCDLLKVPWVQQFLAECSNIPTKCPLAAGSYSAVKFQLPPKNFPYPMLDIDYHGTMTVFVTKTKDVISLLRIELIHVKN